MIVLGIETSCDDTGVGIVDADGRILANSVASQLAAHKPYGGVVPEVAARAHLDYLDDLIKDALKKAGVGFSDLSAVAATCGPGLIGGVMVGAVMGKAIAAASQKPFIAVNHLEAHALTARLGNDIAFPYLLLLVSGGHCQLLVVRGVGAYQRLGTTIDDAVGECFDKCAKLLGLGYPGGPLIERAAAGGNPDAYGFPRPMHGRDGCDFSFSGLKTAVRQLVEKQGSDLSPQFVADVAASLQRTIAEVLTDRARNAIKMMQESGQGITTLVAAGGVASNLAIRQSLVNLAAQSGIMFMAAAPELCTDNGVMVAWAGLERLRLGKTDPLDVMTRPRWPLDEAL